MAMVIAVSPCNVRKRVPRASGGVLWRSIIHDHEQKQQAAQQLTTKKPRAKIGMAKGKNNKATQEPRDPADKPCASKNSRPSTLVIPSSREQTVASVSRQQQANKKKKRKRQAERPPLRSELQEELESEEPPAKKKKKNRDRTDNDSLFEEKQKLTPPSKKKKTKKSSKHATKEASLQAEGVEHNEAEDKKKPPAEKAHKIRFYPRPHQHVQLKQWFGIVRWTYNKCVDYINRRVGIVKAKTLRACFVTKKAWNSDCNLTLKALYSEDEWKQHMAMKEHVLKVPMEIRDSAILDVMKAYKMARVRLKETGQPMPQFKFRSKKDMAASFTVRERHWRKPTCLIGQLLSRSSLQLPKDNNNDDDDARSEKKKKKIVSDDRPSWNQLPQDVMYDSRILKTRDHQYYLCVPKPLERQRESQALLYQQDIPYAQVIAIDPGNGTFATGVDDQHRIKRLCFWLDNLKS